MDGAEVAITEGHPVKISEHAGGAVAGTFPLDNAGTDQLQPTILAADALYQVLAALGVAKAPPGTGPNGFGVPATTVPFTVC